MDQPVDEFREVLVEAVPKIRRFAYSLTNSMADADDLLQATIERALRRQAQFEPGTMIDRWLFRICRNLWIDEMRSMKAKGQSLDIDNIAEPATDGERATHHAVHLAQTQTAMMKLSPEYREILSLVAVEGLSYKEASEVLDIPIGTVMSRLARARGNLAAMLER